MKHLKSVSIAPAMLNIPTRLLVPRAEGEGEENGANGPKDKSVGVGVK